MTEPRDHRPPMPSVDAAAFLREESAAGRHDGEMVAAVLRAAGQQTSPVERPAGLTEREVQVIRLLARGLQTKQVARALGHLGQDRRPPHPERVPKDRSLHPGRGHALRQRTRAGAMGRTPDFALIALAVRSIPCRGCMVIEVERPANS